MNLSAPCEGVVVVVSSGTGTRRLCTRAQDSLVRLHCALESFHANNRAYECKDGCEVYFSFWFIVHRLCIDSFR